MPPRSKFGSQTCVVPKAYDPNRQAALTLGKQDVMAIP